MRIFRDRFRFRHLGAKSLQCVLATLVMAVSILQGASFCFCDSEAQSCGDENCHESHEHDCHSVPESHGNDSFAHDCTHLEVDAINALATSGRIDPGVVSVLGSLFIDLIAKSVDFSVNQPQFKYPPGRIHYGLPPQLIYISNSVKFLC